MSAPTARPSLRDLKAYVGGKSKVKGVHNAIKLSSNESALGPSPLAHEAYLAAADRLALYPDGHSTILRDAIAEVHDLDPSLIVCGNGSDDILSFLATAYLQPGDEAIYCEHGFSLYKLLIQAAGAVPVMAPEVNFAASVDNILSRVTDKTRIVYLANPNNPTGTYLNAGEVARLQAQLPSDVLLVLDGAYAEFVTADDYDDGKNLVTRSENVVMTRTFSKIYGLAFLRVGWGYCPPAIADVLNRLRPPFNVNGVAQLTAAAAIRDREFTRKAVAHNETWLRWLNDEVVKLGLVVTPSIGNFLLIHFGSEAGRTASDADAFLQSKGLILRRLETYGISNGLRLTVGREDDNRKVIAALREFTGA